jgi:hypothetical protein
VALRIAVRQARKARRSAANEARRRAFALQGTCREAPMSDRDWKRSATPSEKLPEALRLPILLHHCDGLSYDEIAEALGMPRGTVGTNIHRGLDRLRSAIPGALSLGGLVALLSAADSAEASAATVDAVSRLARSAPLPAPPWPLKVKASLAVTAGAGLLFLGVLSSRPAPPPSAPPLRPVAHTIDSSRSPSSLSDVAIPPTPKPPQPTATEMPRRIRSRSRSSGTNDT